MVDVQEDKDLRGIGINKVGIRGYQHPIQVQFLGCNSQNTVSITNSYVYLEADKRATHMSRFIDVLNLNRHPISFSSVKGILNNMYFALGSEKVHIEMNFPYFVKKEAPLSKKKGLVSYDCTICAARQKDGEYNFDFYVVIPICSVCPCSKSISKNGAHNQRGLVKVKYKADSDINVESLISCVEKTASAEIFSLLKRLDERYITEFSYDNAKFVEDIVRDAWINLEQIGFTNLIEISVENFESIHHHNAYAEVRAETKREEKNGS